jgi:hypothetical protein
MFDAKKGFKAWKQTAITMKLSPKFTLVLALTLSSGIRAHSQDVNHGRLQADSSIHSAAFYSIPIAPGHSAWVSQQRVTRYSTRLEGDHSLDAATVTEQVFSRYALYTVRLQFTSGAEQSIVVTAPPGGLQPEMRDMSGDSVPNDLVLTSRLLRLPLVVLLNEGNDHLKVAISPGSFASGEGRTLATHQTHRASVLMRSGFKAGGLTIGSELFLPQVQAGFLPSAVDWVKKDSSFSASSGRAPPALATAIRRAS